MGATTIKLHAETKKELDKFREYRNESYDEVIQKMIFIARNVNKEPKLSKWAVKRIEESRREIKKGNYVTHAELKKSLGM